MIGALLKKRRIELGFTQSQISQRTSLSLATIQKIESGAVSPRWKNLEELLKSLNLNCSFNKEIISLDELAALGVPIAQTKPTKSIPELSDAVPLIIHQYDSFPERVRTAIRAFILALKLHFPATYRILHKENRRLSELIPTTCDGRMIKLSRLAKSNLSEVY